MRYLSLLLIFSCTIASAQSPRQIPILTYHQVRDWKAKDSKSDKDYIIPAANIAEHIKMLADSGYHTILPDELISGNPLPSKPIMLTFDDTNEDQFKVARPILIKYHFKAVYFIITGKIGTHPWFMNSQQIKQLSDEGNVIGCHTTSHLNFKKLTTYQFQTEIAQSKKTLEQIIGKPVDYFAYPFGYWNRAGLPYLHQYGFKAAFQLDAPRDPTHQKMTICRIVAKGAWSAATLDHKVKQSFSNR